MSLGDLAALARLVAQGAARCGHYECQDAPRFATTRVMFVYHDPVMPSHTAEFQCDKHAAPVERRGMDGPYGYHFAAEPTAYADDARAVNAVAWGGT